MAKFQHLLTAHLGQSAPLLRMVSVGTKANCTVWHTLAGMPAYLTLWGVDKMFNLHCSIGNPWRKEDFKNLFCWSGKLGKNKAWEFEGVRHNYNLVEVDIGWSIRTDHAGPSINIGLFSYSIEFKIYDTRHWDSENNRWELNDE